METIEEIRKLINEGVNVIVILDNEKIPNYISTPLSVVVMIFNNKRNIAIDGGYSNNLIYPRDNIINDLSETNFYPILNDEGSNMFLSKNGRLFEITHDYDNESSIKDIFDKVHQWKPYDLAIFKSRHLVDPNSRIKACKIKLPNPTDND